MSARGSLARQPCYGRRPLVLAAACASTGPPKTVPCAGGRPTASRGAAAGTDRGADSSAPPPSAYRPRRRALAARRAVQQRRERSERLRLQRVDPVRLRTARYPAAAETSASSSQTGRRIRAENIGPGDLLFFIDDDQRRVARGHRHRQRPVHPCAELERRGARRTAQPAVLDAALSRRKARRIVPRRMWLDRVETTLLETRPSRSSRRDVSRMNCRTWRSSSEYCLRAFTGGSGSTSTPTASASHGGCSTARSM